MADKRIKDLATTATSPAGDDFFAIDGATSNSRKILADSFLQDAPTDATLYGRKDGAWEEAASPDDVPLVPTFVYDGTAGTTQFIYGDIPDNWQQNNSDLTQLYIGNSVASIGSYAFTYCSGLAGDLVIPNSVTSIGSYAFQYCSGFDGNLFIGNSVTTIGDNAIRNCSGLTGSLVIPNSVTYIGVSSFQDCSGFSGNLVIPNSVTLIGNSSFIGCTGLTSVIVPSPTTIIDDYPFTSCTNLTAAYLNQPIGSLGSYALAGSGITNVYIGPDATGYTLGSGQTIGGQSGITVSIWTNYPNVP
jgi:hypothetical protein